MKAILFISTFFLMFSSPLLAQTVTHGVAVGEVSSSSACIWSRTNQPSTMNVVLVGANKEQREKIAVTSQNDFTGKVVFTGLKPDTEYTYSVTFSKNNKASRGVFRTAPVKSNPKALKFCWGGDLAGQNVCRDLKEGFPIFRTINQVSPDFFIALGDMIYADNPCTSLGKYGNKQVPGALTPATTLAEHWQRWKYNRKDVNYQQLLAKTPYFAIWDDHEVVNDFGPLHDTRSHPPYTKGKHLMPMGFKAFLDYNPFLINPHTPSRLYRSHRWGKHLEMFFLDTRQYRDANSAKDSLKHPKTMLGREQLVWFKQKLKNSNATWKIIISSVPISIPTGYPPEKGRDGWANFDQQTGFEQELSEILRFMHEIKLNNSIWITTDVHFATGFIYTPFQKDPKFKVHEFVSGPLHAGLFPSPYFDASFSPQRLFFYGPKPEKKPKKLSYKIARQYMNFGAIEIDKSGTLTVSIYNVDGKVIFNRTLTP